MTGLATKGRGDEDINGEDDPRDTIVLVPGIDGTALLFYRQIPLLEKHFRVVTFPLRDDAATMSTLIDDLRDVVTDLAPRRVILLGESFGGALSMSFALQHPQLIDGLVIINSFPWLEKRLQVHVGRLLLWAIPWAALPYIRRGTAARIHSRHTNTEDLAEFWARTDNMDGGGYRQRLAILRRYDIRRRLQEIRTQTLFLAADDDKLIRSVRWATYMKSRLPRSELAVLRGYGHVCLITHDLDVTDTIVPWWGRVTAAWHGDTEQRPV